MRLYLHAGVIGPIGRADAANTRPAGRFGNFKLQTPDMKHYKLLLGAGLLLLNACSKDDSPSTFTLNVIPKHHGRAIDSCTVYIKYNTVDAPANGIYDDSVRCVPVGGVSTAVFRSLKRGSHYLYGYGWDPTLTPPKAVKGGYAAPDNGDDVQSVELAVSEDH